MSAGISQNQRSSGGHRPPLQQAKTALRQFCNSPPNLGGELPNSIHLINRETVQQSRSAGGYQIRLAATAACVSGIPGAIVAALFVGVAKLDLPSAVGVACVIAAGVIHRIGIRASVGLRPGQDVMRIRHIADAVHDPCLFRQRKLLSERVANTCLLNRVAMQIGYAHGDTLAARVIPGSAADAVTRVNRSEEHTSELQSRGHLVCRLQLEKKKENILWFL